MKKNIYLIIGVALALFVSSIFVYVSSPNINKISIDEASILQKSSYKSYRDKCLKFIENKLTSDYGGIYTNYLSSSVIDTDASGYEILSESEGLIMLFYASANNKKMFDKHFDYIKKHLLLQNGLFKWRYIENRKDITSTSASIDDLRIVRALIYAYSLWKEDKYISLLQDINNGLKKHNIYKECLNDYYDLEYDDYSDILTLSYMDFFTIKQICNIDKSWRNIYDKGLKIVDGGYISDKLPLYEKCYSIDDDTYLSDEINTIDALLVVLHLCEVKEHKKESIDWIRSQIYKSKAIYSGYTIDGRVNNYEESTAVYAIAARIAKEVNDLKLYNNLIRIMIRLQVNDKNSMIYGSFGDKKTFKVYSFDNLQAILAF